MPLTRRRPEDKSDVWHPKKSVRLYLDEVDEILAVLKHTDPQVEVTTPDFEGKISTAEELKVAGQTALTDLTLSAGNNEYGITVELRQPLCVRIVPRDAFDLAGAGQRVQDVLSRRQERFGGWHLTGDAGDPLHIAPAVAGVAASIIAVLSLETGLADSSSRERPASSVSGWVWLVGAGLLAILVLVLLLRKMTGPNRSPRATVVLEYRADAPTWWERNRTSVLIALATNAATSLLFFLLGSGSEAASTAAPGS